MGALSALALRVTRPKRALELYFSTSKGYPINGGTALAAATSRLSRNGQLAVDNNTSRHARARASSPLVVNRPDADVCRRGPNHTHRHRRRRTEPSPPRVHVDGQRVRVLKRPRASSARARRSTRTIPIPDGTGAEYVQGPLRTYP